MMKLGKLNKLWKNSFPLIRGIPPDRVISKDGRGRFSGDIFGKGTAGIFKPAVKPVQPFGLALQPFGTFLYPHNGKGYRVKAPLAFAAAFVGRFPGVLKPFGEVLPFLSENQKDDQDHEHAGKQRNNDRRRVHEHVHRPVHAEEAGKRQGNGVKIGSQHADKKGKHDAGKNNSRRKERSGFHSVLSFQP
jgi:hypothetical protein